MGRFVHEAAVTDPKTGIVYMTEDDTPAGFYRFVPADRNDLSAGGTLQMLAVQGQPGYDTRKHQTVGYRPADELGDDPGRRSRP